MDYMVNESQPMLLFGQPIEFKPKITRLTILIDEDKEMYDDQADWCKSPFKIFKHYSNTSKSSTSSTLIPFNQFNTQNHVIDLRDKILIHDKNEYSNTKSQLSPLNSNQRITNQSDTFKFNNNNQSSLWMPFVSNVN